MEAEILGLEASILLALAPFGSALGTAKWPMGDIEEGTLRFSKERAPQVRFSVAGGTKLDGQEADDRFQ